MIRRCSSTESGYQLISRRSQRGIVLPPVTTFHPRFGLDPDISEFRLFSSPLLPSPPSSLLRLTAILFLRGPLYYFHLLSPTFLTSRPATIPSHLPFLFRFDCGIFLAKRQSRPDYDSLSVLMLVIVWKILDIKTNLSNL